MVVGANITAFGEIKISRYGVQMAHPEYHVTGTKAFESGLLPVYPAVKGLHQNKLRQLVRLAINAVSREPLHCLSIQDLSMAGVTGVQADLLSALKQIHLPDKDADIFAQTVLLEGLKSGRTQPVAASSSKSSWRINWHSYIDVITSTSTRHRAVRRTANWQISSWQAYPLD